MRTPQTPRTRTRRWRQVRLPGQPIELDATRALRMVGRAVRRRCPSCGGQPIFEGYFRLRPYCRGCGLRLERGEADYFLGAYLLNLAAAELVFAVGFLLLLLATWPTPPWDMLEYVCAAGVVVAPIVLYPFSKTVWLAADLALRPPTADDIEQHG